MLTDHFTRWSGADGSLALFEISRLINLSHHYLPQKPHHKCMQLLEIDILLGQVPDPCSKVKITLLHLGDYLIFSSAIVTKLIILFSNL